MRRNRCVYLIVLSSVALTGASGCRQATLLTGSIASQGLCPRVDRGGQGSWAFNGLNARVHPRMRPGSYASATREVRFLDLDDLGSHGYCFKWSEQSGIVYTCRAGHIDIAHVRKAADGTGYIAAVTLRQIEKGRTKFRFKLIEPSTYFVTLTYPDNWSELDGAARERIAREVSCRIGQRLSYTALTWHEIITWFGYRFRPYKSEFPSAFSWEDNYSNLLGAHIGAAALADQSRTFSEAVTELLAQRLLELGVQPAAVARQAAETMRGQWYSPRGLETVIHRRNFDVGLDDGYVTPCLVPNVPACAAAEPVPLAAPAFGSPDVHGFSVNVTIEPRVWEKKRILRALCSAGGASGGRLDPAVHFPVIMNYIEAQAAWAKD